MTIEPLFTVPDAPADASVTIVFEGTPLRVPAGITVAAALLVGGVREFRSSVVGGVPRAPYCMMGVCFECLVEIDGVPARQSCLIPVHEGMVVARQLGAAHLDEFRPGEVP